MKTILEYLENRKNNIKLYKFLEDRNLLGIKVPHYEFEAYVDLYYDILQYDARQYAKSLINDLKRQKGRKRTTYVVVTSNEDYDWCARCTSLKSCQNRATCYSTLLNVVSDTLFEFVANTGKNFIDLSISIIDAKDMINHHIFAEYFTNEENYPSVINVKTSFWDKSKIG